MGRELKRVPLDFDWELNKAWDGYINHHYAKSYQCLHCEGLGFSSEAKHLHDLWYGFVPFKPEDNGVEPHKCTDQVIIDFATRNVKKSPDFYKTYNQDFSGTPVEREAKRLAKLFNESWQYNLNQDDIDVILANEKQYTHNFLDGEWVKIPDPTIPTPKQFNDVSITHCGASGLWFLIKAKCEKLGVSSLCSSCDGENTLWLSEEDKLACEAWKPTEPPVGEGYQIWETVSEGGPISPVFASPEELAAHMTTTRWGADQGTSYESWMSFIVGPGWAPSGIISGANL